MISQNPYVIALLLGVSHQFEAVKPYPPILGLSTLTTLLENQYTTPATFGIDTTTSTTALASCYACVRGGWDWYDSSPYFTGSASEIFNRGTVRDTENRDALLKNKWGCCKPSITQTSTNCPAGYDSPAVLKTNVRQSLQTTITAGTTYLYQDFQIAACHQDSAVCDLTNKSQVMEFANISAAKKKIALSNFTKNHKCSYLIKTLAGAPSFQNEGLANSMSDIDIDIHYIEYDSTVTFETLFAGKEKYIDGTSNLNKVRGIYYNEFFATSTITNQKKYHGGELPWVYMVMNPSPASVSEAQKSKRYLPASLVGEFVESTNVRITAYNHLKQIYDDFKTTYEHFANYKFEPDDPNDYLQKMWPPPGRFMPTIPLKPFKPVYYTDANTMGIKSPLLENADLQYADWGGWGDITFGILKPNQGAHSYGTLGQGDSKAAIPSIPATILERQIAEVPEDLDVNRGIHKTQEFMSDTTSNAKYMLITIMPTNYDWVGQVDAGVSTSLSLQIGSYKWGSTKLELPAVPDAATDPSISSGGIKLLTIGVISFFWVGYCVW